MFVNYELTVYIITVMSQDLNDVIFNTTVIKSYRGNTKQYVSLDFCIFLEIIEENSDR